MSPTVLLLWFGHRKRGWKIGRVFDDENERNEGKRENSSMRTRSFSNLSSSDLTAGDLLTEEDKTGIEIRVISSFSEESISEKTRTTDYITL